MKNMIFKGKNVVYVIATVPRYSYGITNTDFVLGTLMQTGEFTNKLMSENQLIQAINNGLNVENVTLKNDRLALKGDRKITALDRSLSNLRTCIAEITNADTGAVSYMVVDTHSVESIVSKEEMLKLASYRLISNYYITKEGSLKRSPNQDVTQLEITGSSVIDTYDGMTNKELSELLAENGFKLGYKSEKFFTHQPWSKHGKDTWQAYAWFDKNGAIIFYNNHLEENKDNPFYSDCCLYIDTDVKYIDMSVCYGQMFSNGPGHQRLYIDGRQNLMKNYNSMLTAVEGLNPWDYHTALVSSGERLNFSRKDYYIGLKNKAFSMVGAPSESDDNMFLYSVYSELAMLMTVKKFTGELREILSDWERTFGDRLGSDIAKDIVFYSRKTNLAKQTDTYLKGLNYKLPKPLSEYVKEAQRKSDEQKAKRMAEINKKKSPISSILSMFDKK